ncbi:MAG: adenylate/guanylate cyclase domain-containing protein [Candidatus Eremiobacteraeota bacterium]|nr:adenylate/guanylate cyclase domain-containing protein [Candidatus Eremiobacteraeota bacterium]
MAPPAAGGDTGVADIGVPTGTVTFLFTDIEGSTKRWETHGDNMRAAVESHDALLRGIFEGHNGYVFKTVGDAFCVAFASAADAVSGALDAQRALAQEDHSTVGGIRVRMGLHTGSADERSGDYFGPTVNRVARLMSVGHGGQILVSDSTRMLLQGELPAEAGLTDLGSHRLKDLAQPEHIWMVTVPDLPATFPALTSLDAFPNNLPVQITSFRGREQDLEDLKTLLRDHRLVTIHGPGGMGKTRLSIQAGAEMLEDFADGVWLADLSSLRYPELASSVVSKALNISQAQDQTADQAIVAALKRKKLLLLLDNCEHVIDDSAKLADTILKQCPDVRILASSRQGLQVTGEQIMRLQPLGFPEPRAHVTLENAMSYSAIALFVDRALAVNKSFALDDDAAYKAGEICRHLDGLPLAIELAAARVKVLSLDSLAQRLDKRFSLLTGGDRTALERQRTLGALIDWSYELLTPSEQLLFCRVSVFAGGFALEAAEAVCVGEGIEDFEILDLLASLADKSLVIAETSQRSERYRLLESIRAYGWEKLKASNDLDRLVALHADHYKAAAVTADRTFGTKPDAAWLETVEPEIDNFRVVIEWALGPAEQPAVAGLVIGCLERLWREGGLEAEGRKWIATAQARVDDETEPLVAARLWRALTSLTSGAQCLEAAEKACALYEKLGDGRGLAHALTALALALFHAGRIDEASAANDRALGWFREYADKRNVAACLRQQATIAEAQGDIPAARDLYKQAQTVFKALGVQSSVAMILACVAELEFKEGNASEALRSVAEAIELGSWGKNATNLAIYHANAAAYRIALDSLPAARDAARDAVHWAMEAKNELILSDALGHLALIATRTGEPRRAAQLAGFVDAHYTELGESRESTEVWSYDQLMRSLREQLDAAALDALLKEGAAMMTEQAVAEALNITIEPVTRAA